jgi:hypothetical protein
MPRAISRDPIYYRRRYTPEVIELCVRRYLTYRLSYRDLSAMMAERDVAVSHTTILRWVQHYVPEFERRWARFSKPINPSWRVDETSVPVQGRWNYLYRAVDRDGKSVHSLLCESRTIESAQEFFRQAGARMSLRHRKEIEDAIVSPCPHAKHSSSMVIVATTVGMMKFVPRVVIWAEMPSVSPTHEAAGQTQHHCDNDTVYNQSSTNSH